MRRRIAVALLGLGVVGGFSAGFASLVHRAHGRYHARHAHFERHVADLCARAALDATRK